VELDALVPLPSVPNTREEIASHASQLGFAAPLAAELRMLRALSSRLSATEAAKLPKLHVLRPARGLAGLDAASKLNTDWAFLQELFKAGRAAADAWVQQFVERPAIEPVA
jgi:NTE family protein